MKCFDFRDLRGKCREMMREICRWERIEDVCGGGRGGGVGVV